MLFELNFKIFQSVTNVLRTCRMNFAAQNKSLIEYSKRHITLHTKPEPHAIVIGFSLKPKITQFILLKCLASTVYCFFLWPDLYLFTHARIPTSIARARIFSYHFLCTSLSNDDPEDIRQLHTVSSAHTQLDHTTSVTFPADTSGLFLTCFPTWLSICSRLVRLRCKK